MDRRTTPLDDSMSLHQDEFDEGHDRLSESAKLSETFRVEHIHTKMHITERTNEDSTIN